MCLLIRLRRQISRTLLNCVSASGLVLLLTFPATAADSSNVDTATRQIERGGDLLGKGRIGSGVETTAKGIGHTVEEGAKFVGKRFEGAGRAAAPHARASGRKFKSAGKSVGRMTTRFIDRLFGPDSK